MARRRWAVPVVLALSVAGCTSRVPLTKEIREGLDPGEFKQLQCYTSHEIVLRRVLKSEEKDVTPGHTLRIENEKRIEEVVIRAFTPGVVVEAKGDKLLVSFESPINGQEAFLVFGWMQKWNQPAYYFFPDGDVDLSEAVVYAGKNYTTNKESHWASLMIDASRGSTKSRESREVEGRRVADMPPK